VQQPAALHVWHAVQYVLTVAAVHVWTLLAQELVGGS
jgi:hypothetical protein